MLRRAQARCRQCAIDWIDLKWSIRREEFVTGLGFSLFLFSWMSYDLNPNVQYVGIDIEKIPSILSHRLFIISTFFILNRIE